MSDDKKRQLEEVRARWKSSGVLSLDDLDILMWFAVNDYDLSAEEIAANVRSLLEHGHCANEAGR